jgi:hypothetical protein
LNPEKQRLCACSLSVLPARRGTPVLADIDDGVKKDTIIDFYVSPLFREKANDFLPLFPRYFHGSGISCSLGVNWPLDVY